MTSVLYKMADINAGYLKVKLDLLKHWHPCMQEKEYNGFVGRMDKSVLRVTV